MPRSDSLPPSGQLQVAFSSALKQLATQLEVLSILDSTAETWPGIHACVTALETAGHQTMRKLVEEEKAGQERTLRIQVRRHLRILTVSLAPLRR